MKIKELDQQYIANTYARFDLEAASGKGATCKDFDGKSYVDFSSGIGVNSLGFCNEKWVAAVTRQASTLQHICNLYYSAPQAELAQKLCGRTIAKNVFF